MGRNTIILTVRFLLEITGLVALGVWGWVLGGDGIVKFVLALAAPIFAAVIWGIFAVPGDPSRSGNAPVIVPGLVRFILEIAFFSSVVWALSALHYSMLGWLFGIVVIIVYVADIIKEKGRQN